MLEIYGKDVVALSTYDGKATYFTFPALFARKIEIYNKNLAFYRRWQNHWFVGDFISTVPDDLNPLHSFPTKQ